MKMGLGVQGAEGRVRRRDAAGRLRGAWTAQPSSASRCAAGAGEACERCVRSESL